MTWTRSELASLPTTVPSAPILLFLQSSATWLLIPLAASFPPPLPPAFQNSWSRECEAVGMSHSLGYGAVGAHTWAPEQHACAVANTCLAVEVESEYNLWIGHSLYLIQWFLFYFISISWKNSQRQYIFYYNTYYKSSLTILGAEKRTLVVFSMFCSFSLILDNFFF